MLHLGKGLAILKISLANDTLGLSIRGNSPAGDVALPHCRAVPEWHRCFASIEIGGHIVFTVNSEDPNPWTILAWIEYVFVFLAASSWELIFWIDLVRCLMSDLIGGADLG
jgi:hypothetical protein